MPSINNPNVISEGRRPRAQVKINDIIVPWIDWTVDNNLHYQADTFHVKIPAAALPAAVPASSFATTAVLIVEVLAGFPLNPDRYNASELKSLIVGRADLVSFDPIQNVIEISGRDYTSVFIDTKTSQKYPNFTAGQIASLLASSHGLTPNVMPTAGSVGAYYSNNTVRMQDQRSEWDLLTWLAAKEGYTVYVTGKTLNFVPLTLISAADPYVIQYTPPSINSAAPTINAMSLHFERNMTIAKGIVVKVSAHGPGSGKKSLTASWPTSAKGAGVGKAGPAGDVQTYAYTYRRNMTPDELLKQAQKIYTQIAAHEVKLSAELPGDNLMSVDHPIVVAGTDTAYDQVYYPDAITRSMDARSGYRMSVTAKNVSDQLTVAGQTSSQASL